MHKKPLYYLLVLAVLLVALVFSIRAYRHQVFKKTATGLEYRVIRKGKGPNPQEGEMLLLTMSYKTSKGTVIWNSQDEEFPLAIPYSKELFQEEGSFAEVINMLQKGDNLIFRLSAEKLFGDNVAYIAKQYGFTPDTKILLHLQLQDIMTAEAYQKWATEHRAMAQKRRQEEVEQQRQKDAKAIASYLADHQITAETTASGLHYVIDTSGQGAKPKPGDKVKVNYTGWLLEGKIFDTSLEEVAKKHGMHDPKRTYQPFEFELGAGQIIQGWDEGIRLLNKGSKARLFIPSILAYGSQGVGNGMIPPHAILVFEVALVDIQSGS